jgi:hypothetical protein
MANSSESKHEENSGPVPQQFFQPLPREVIRYWLEGNYTGGIAPSVAYDQLGWALMFRGFYRYQLSAPKAQNSHRGYCVIDLQNGEICCYGVRLFSASSQWKEIADYVHPFLWKSEAGTIRAGRSSARLSCALRTLATRR